MAEWFKGGSTRLQITKLAISEEIKLIWENPSEKISEKL
jgi:hypothetical protein